MFRNYLTVALRGLLRHKTYAVVNLLGLGLAMASCIVLYLYARDQLSYDEFHEHADRTYRVTGESLAITPYVLGSTIKDHFGDQVEVSRLVKTPKTISTEDGLLLHEELTYFVDSNFPQIFTVTPLQGDASSALAVPDAAVLSQRAALTYFGTDDPLGQILHVDGLPYRVAAVVETYPHRSHFDFNLLLPMSSAPGWATSQEWFLNVAHTYVLAPPGFREAAFTAELRAVVKQTSKGRSGAPPRLQRLQDIHLHSHLDHELGVNGDMAHLYIIGAITAIILVVACINFVNLSTARYRERAREVGVRKVCGASRSQLVWQFLGESTLLSLCSLAVGAALVEAVLPSLNAVFALQLTVPYGEPHLLVAYVASAALIGLGAGAYAAFVLASYQPAATFERDLSPLGPGDWLRKGLVVTQIAASVTLMVCALIIHIQLRHMRDKDLGFDRDRLIVVENSLGVLGTHYGAYKAEALRHPAIQAISGGPVPGFFRGRTNRIERPDGTVLEIRDHEVDHGYVETTGLRLIAGRGFSPGFPADSSAACIVNSAYVDALPASDGRLAESFGFCEEVVGVVDDFHTASLYERVMPAAILLRPRAHMKLLVRVTSADDMEGVVAHLKETWQDFVEDRPFRYSILEDDLARTYADESRFGWLMSGFTAVSLLIGCMGMYGLATFTAQRRTREIGVRRVLGATVSQVMWLLCGTFGKLVLVANLVAWPIAYEAGNRWLQTFAYRVEMGYELFLICGAVAMAVVVATVGSQAARSAMTNPVEALRLE